MRPRPTVGFLNSISSSNCASGLISRASSRVISRTGFVTASTTFFTENTSISPVSGLMRPRNSSFDLKYLREATTIASSIAWTTICGSMPFSLLI